VLERVSDDRAGANPERDLMRRELGAKIAQALTKLTPRERMVFELKHYQGLRLRTIGEMLNTTEETAKNTLFRATQKLRSVRAPMRKGAAGKWGIRYELRLDQRQHCSVHLRRASGRCPIRVRAPRAALYFVPRRVGIGARVQGADGRAAGAGSFS